MYKWDFDAAEWTDDEKKNIEAIVREASDMFSDSYSVIKDEEKKENYIKLLVSLIRKDINKCDDSPYGKYTSFEAKKKLFEFVKFLEINDCFQCLKAIYAIIKKYEILQDDQRGLNDCSIQDLLEVLNSNLCNDQCCKFDKKKQELIDHLMNIKGLLLGVFVSQEDYRDDSYYITIYMKAINKCKSVSSERDVLVEQVIVHELFHAMHYIQSDSNIKRTWLTKTREKKKKEAVQEGLADYFAYSYLKNKVSNDGDDYNRAMQDLLRKWKIHEFPDYPYSGAMAFIPPKSECFGQTMKYEKYENDYVRMFEVLKRTALKEWRKPYGIMEESINNAKENIIVEDIFMDILDKYMSPEEYIARVQCPDSEDNKMRYYDLIGEMGYHLHTRVHIDKFNQKYSLDDLISIIGLMRSIDPDTLKKYRKELIKNFYNGSVDRFSAYIERLYNRF